MDLIFTNKRFPVLLPPVCKYHFQQLVAECFCAAVVEKQLRNNGPIVMIPSGFRGGVGVLFFSVNRPLLSVGNACSVGSASCVSSFLCVGLSAVYSVVDRDKAHADFAVFHVLYHAGVGGTVKKPAAFVVVNVVSDICQF